MIAQVAIYEGRKDLGLDILKRIQENQICRWGGSWEAWNSCSPKADDGARGYGLDYSHNLSLWNTPAALVGEDISGPLKPSGLADRILKAARTNGDAKADDAPIPSQDTSVIQRVDQFRSRLTRSVYPSNP
jgi:hypothetical protein